MVLNVTFNNISVTSWRSILLVEETGGPGENHQPVTSQISVYSWIMLDILFGHLFLGLYRLSLMGTFRQDTSLFMDMFR
jgi:hypothetical protein